MRLFILFITFEFLCTSYVTTDTLTHLIYEAMDYLTIFTINMLPLTTEVLQVYNRLCSSISHKRISHVHHMNEFHMYITCRL